MQGFSVTVTIDMLWGDMDALGHANNARFFTWFEAARIAYFEKLAGMQTHPASELGPILKKVECEYLQPIVYPAKLRVGARVTRTGTTSFVMEHAIARAESPDHPLARGTSVVVLINYVTGQKVPMPDELRAAIQTLEAR